MGLQRVGHDWTTSLSLSVCLSVVVYSFNSSSLHVTLYKHHFTHVSLPQKNLTLSVAQSMESKLWHLAFPHMSVPTLSPVLRQVKSSPPARMFHCRPLGAGCLSSLSSLTAMLLFFVLKILNVERLLYEVCVCSVAKSCPTLCNPMDCSPPGSSVYGTSRARILEWVAIAFSRVASLPRGRSCVSCLAGDSLPLSYQGSPSVWRPCAKHLLCKKGWCGRDSIFWGKLGYLGVLTLSYFTIQSEQK